MVGEVSLTNAILSLKTVQKQNSRKNQLYHFYFIYKYVSRCRFTMKVWIYISIELYLVLDITCLEKNDSSHSWMEVSYKVGRGI